LIAKQRRRAVAWPKKFFEQQFSNCFRGRDVILLSISETGRRFRCRAE
jgi:hypothetical protein